MSVEPRGRQVVSRIGFAERWLLRAKRQCVEGDLSRGLLTLALAEAEMHYALEAGAPAPAKLAPRRGVSVVVLVMAAAAAGAVLLARGLPSVAPTQGAEPGAPIVRFASRVGTLLDLVQVPQTAVSVTAPAVGWEGHGERVRAKLVEDRAVSPTRLGQVGWTAPAVSPAQAVPLQPIVVQVLQTLPASPISEAELIDLALTADRMLRREPTSP